MQCVVDLKDKANILKAIDNESFDLTVDIADDDASDKEADEASEVKEKVTYTIAILDTINH